jgi:endonuclease IV
MHIGAHTTVDNAIRHGLTACQIFTIVPQKIQEMRLPDPAAIRDNRLAVWIHSSYLINFWNPKPYNVHFAKVQLKNQVALGAQGVIFHIPKAPASALVARYKMMLAARPKNSTIVLENRALRPDGDLTYETPEKLNALVETFVAAGIQLGDIKLCIDTAHLYCGGAVLRTRRDAREWFARFRYPKCVALIHLNGQRSATFRDIHALAFARDDLIWRNTPYAESGFKYIIDLARRYKFDIILECEFDAKAIKLLKSIV